MNSLQQRSRTADTVASAVLVAALGVALAVVGSVVGTPGHVPVASATSVSPSPPLQASAAAVPSEGLRAVRIIMRAGDQAATATLADTRAGRQLAAMLPLTVDLQDPFGQAKSGALPHALEVAGSNKQFHPVTGGIYYWPAGGDLAIFYDALGQAVPPPGLIRLGSVDSGLDTIASSRGDITLTIQRAD